MEERETKIIEDYVSKMLEVQQSRFEKPLSLAELKEIADSVGMSESDWEASQQEMAFRLKTGQAHLKEQNWTDAITELKQAVAINPYSEEGLYGLAVAHHELYKKTGNELHRNEAQSYANRVLKNETQQLDNATIALLQNIRNTETVQKQKKQKLWLRIAAAAAVLFVVVLLICYTAISTVRSKETRIEEQLVQVEKNWGQVENVYQRRESVIPQIVNLTKSASKYDQTKLEELQQLQKNLDPSNREDYRQKQEEISKRLTEMMGNLQGNATTLRDVQVQIEGSENRIRVEWKKYNESVAEYNNAILQYNNAIKGFPASMLGFKAKEKMKIEIKK